jgi:hypothetical protein
MRFDLLGFSFSRKRHPKGVIGPKQPADWYVNIFHFHIKRKPNPLNPFNRSNFSLLLIGVQDKMWHIEVLFLEFRNDKKELYQKQFLEQLSGGRGKKFTDRVKAAGRW